MLTKEVENKLYTVNINHDTIIANQLAIKIQKGNIIWILLTKI